MEDLRKIISSAVLFMFCSLLYAQNRITASGTIVDETGTPVIGATVMEKGTANGTVTDIDGNFSLNASEGTPLTISYIGYSTIEVKAAAKMNIQLKQEANELNEVIVTGYTTQRKADLTGAVAVMDMKGAMSKSEPNMLSSMQGKLAGVNIVTDAAPGGGG